MLAQYDKTHSTEPAPLSSVAREASDSTTVLSLPDPLERRNIRYYLGGLSLIGAAGSTTVILAPIIGVVTLGASASQVGALTLIYLVLSVGLQVPFAGWADRRRDHLKILPLTCIASALIAATVPLLYLAGLLTINALYLVVALYSLVAVFRGSLGHSIVNQLAPSQRRGAVIGRLNGLSGGVDTVSQSVAGGLVSIVPAPIAMFTASLATLLAPIMLAKVRLPASAPARAGSPRRRPVTAERLTEPEARLVSAQLIVHKLVRMPALWIVAGYSFANSLVEPVFVPFVLRQLKVPPGLVGLLLATGALGGIAGGWLVARLIGRLGLRTGLTLAVATSSLGILSLLLAAPGATASACIVCYELLTSFGGTIVVAAVFGRLQEQCGIGTVARTLASANTALQVAGIAGVVAGIAVSLALPARLNVALYLVGALLIIGYLLVGRSSSWEPGPPSTSLRQS